MYKENYGNDKPKLIYPFKNNATDVTSNAGQGFSSFFGIMERHKCLMVRCFNI